MDIQWEEGRDFRGTPFKEAVFTEALNEDEDLIISARQYKVNTFITIIDLNGEGYSDYTQDGNGDGMILAPAEFRCRVSNISFNADPLGCLKKALSAFDYNYVRLNI